MEGPEKILYYDPKMSKGTVCLINCIAKTPFCLGVQKLKADSVKKNIKKNKEYICAACSKFAKKQEKCKKLGIEHKYDIIDNEYLKRELSGKIGTCDNDCHDSRCRNIIPNYPYKKNEIPEEDLTGRDGKKFKKCLGCRTYRTQNRKNNKDFLLSKRDLTSEYITCVSTFHKSTSEIPRDRVPINMFKKEGTTDVFYEYCLDCRLGSERIKKNLREKRENEKNENGIIFCTACLSIKEENEMGINDDGTISSYCILCKENTKLKYKKRKKYFRQLQLERIIEKEASCEICNCIFLKPDSEKYDIKKIPTSKNEDGINILEYEGKIYIVKDFLKEFHHLLEYRILDFDHMNQSEKSGLVCEMQSIDSMTKESKKCQLLDSLCHVKVTIQRESGISYYNEKFEYVKNIKLKGCEFCSYIPENEKLVRFMHMDHIFAEEKIESVGIMVQKIKYSLKDVKEECKKCRVLCIFCHRLRTNYQFDSVDVTIEYPTDKEVLENRQIFNIEGKKSNIKLKIIGTTKINLPNS